MPGQAPSALTDSDLLFLLRLRRLGRRKFGRLLAAADCTAPGSRKERQQLLAAGSSPPGEATELSALRDALERHVDRLLWFEDLPLALREIPDPPWVLFLKGNEQVLAAPRVAIVGSRRCSARAAEWTRAIAAQLAAAGWWVISGLALGIDGAAHEGVLSTASGNTAAVLGSGLAQPTPLQHSRLAERLLVAGGALLSEHLPASGARAQHFPERNRLVTGLSAGLVVVEASERSGSLVSARLALEQGRELMAVPGPAGYPNSRGCHQLLRDGAALVESSEDILEVLGVPATATDSVVAAGSLEHSKINEPPEALSPTFPLAQDAALAKQLYLAVDALPQPLEVLATQVQADVPRVAYVLTLLELHGWLRRVSGGYLR